MSAKQADIKEVEFDHLGESGLPPGWTWSLLGKICKTSSGGTPSRRVDAYFKGDNPWVKSGELPDGPVNEIEEYVTNDAINNSSAKVFPKGTLLIALYGATVGKLGILNRDAATNQAVCAIFPSEQLDTKYLFWYLRYVRSDLLAKAIGGAQPNISQGILQALPIPVAPVDQQLRIVAELEKQFSRLDEAVANLKRVKANLKRYKASVLKAAVEGKLTEEWRKAYPNVVPASELLKGISDDRKSKASKQKAIEKLNEDKLPQLPHGWLWVRMTDVGDIQLGRQRAPRYHKGRNMRPYLRVQNVFEDRIDTSDVMEMDYPPADFAKYRLEPGDILLNEGQSPELLGRPAIYKGEVENACFTNTLIRFKTSPPMKPEYPLIVFRGYMRTGRFTNEGTITTNIAHLSAGRFANIEFPLPPLEEQDVIVKDVARRLSIIDMLEKETEQNILRAENLRQATLKRAFSRGVMEDKYVS